jgi:Na+-transporting NADH:ubiquinone oxidoreductase subunit B
MGGLLSVPGNAIGGYRRILRLQLLALLPVSIAAVLNSGYQYLAVLAREPERVGDDLRSNLAHGLGVGYEDPGLYDFLSPALLGIAIVQVRFPSAASQHPLWQGLAGYAGSDAIALFHRGGEAALAEVGVDLWAAFVGSTSGTLGTTSVLAVILGAGLLLLTRVISWRLLLAQLIGLSVIATLFNLLGGGTGASAMPLHWHLLLGSFAFGAVFIACDPVASCCTNPGRWIQGFLIGALVVLIRVANSTHPDAVIPAILLASIMAPLIDHAVIAWNIRQRARRHV